jgi:uncharacterized protein with HEPN domain
MSRRDPTVSLRQMRDHADEVVELVRGRNRRDLDTDRLLALAVVRLLEIIGEAAGRVALADQVRRPSVPWSAIVGLRNWLIHGYDDIDHDIVWQDRDDRPPQARRGAVSPTSRSGTDRWRGSNVVWSQYLLCRRRGCGQGARGGAAVTVCVSGNDRC